MTNQEKKILEKYKEYLSTAYYSDYTRQLTRSELEELLVVYRSVIGNFTDPLNCTTCILKLLKKLGEIYFKPVTKVESKSAAKPVSEQVNPTNNPEVNPTTNPEVNPTTGTNIEQVNPTTNPTK